MGRGRQKAKHTKIARELKSFSPQVNYDALERELTGHSHNDDPSTTSGPTTSPRADTRTTTTTKRPRSGRSVLSDGLTTVLGSDDAAPTASPVVPSASA